jgi:hypothetical protein
MGGQGEAGSGPVEDCPAAEPANGAACSPGPARSCSYEDDTHCWCPAGIDEEWDCQGCPEEGPLLGESCSGFEGEVCDVCSCPDTADPEWDCTAGG